MVEYNKYDDLKEQQLISNLIYGATISEQPQQLAANSEMYTHIYTQYDIYRIIDVDIYYAVCELCVLIECLYSMCFFFSLSL